MSLSRAISIGTAGACACALLTLHAGKALGAAGSQRSYTISAHTLHDPNRAVRVYLPPSYADATGRRYPTVYLLHGWPGSEMNWIQQGDAIRTAERMMANGEIPELILVFPKGRGAGLLGRSLYVNSYDGSSRIEDFMTTELVNWVDSTFRTERSPASRGVIGLSEGGTAAMNLCLLHPDVFGACGSHSALYRMRNGFGLRGVLGTEPTASRILAEHSPLRYVENVAPRLTGLVIYFDCGTTDEALNENRELDRKLADLQIPHEYREFPGGHNWNYWRAHLKDSLKAVTVHMW